MQFMALYPFGMLQLLNSLRLAQADCWFQHLQSQHLYDRGLPRKLYGA